MNLFFRFCSINLVFFAGITACRKPAEEPTPDVNRLRISKLTQTIASATIKDVVTEFIYDDQQRVDKIVFGNANSVKYYYNGTDKNPYKASGAVSNPSLIADIYYTYDNSGKLVRDSAKSTGTSEVLTHDYTYSSDKILVTKGYYMVTPNGMITGNTTNDTFYIKNKNIVEAVYLTGSIGQPGYYYKLSYDDKINPMSKLNIASIKVIEGLNGLPDIMGPGICPNNITAYTSGTIVYGPRRSDNATQAYKFTYTKEGLPETCTITTQIDTYTIKYTYEEIK